MSVDKEKIRCGMCSVRSALEDFDGIESASVLVNMLASLIVTVAPSLKEAIKGADKAGKDIKEAIQENWHLRRDNNMEKDDEPTKH